MIDTLLRATPSGTLKQGPTRLFSLAANTVEVDLLRLARPFLSIVLLLGVPRITRQVGALCRIQVEKARHVGLRAFGSIQILVVAGAVEIHREALCITHLISLWFIPAAGVTNSSTVSNGFRSLACSM
ncbi:MAG TPA: hypothetical protein VES70_27605 [Pseudomonas sp.]|nr:hypothetical protein [Pseudomonas sp.]